MTRLQEVKARLDAVNSTMSLDVPFSKCQEASEVLHINAVGDMHWLITQLEQALEVLKEVEWEGSVCDPDERCGCYEIPACPCCYGLKRSGHEEDCKLAALITRLEG